MDRKQAYLSGKAQHAPMNGHADNRGTAPNRGALIRQLPAVVLGSLAAVVTVVALDHFRERPPSSTPFSRASRGLAPNERFLRTVLVEGRGLDRVAELERQVRDLEERLYAGEAESTEERTPRFSHEESMARVDEAFAAFERGHERDVPDPTWAPDATTSLTSGLFALGEEIGFKVVQADCRMTTCRARVTFEDYASAQARGPRLVEQLYPGLNCAQRMRWTPPVDSKAPYSTELYLDCAEQRAGVVHPVESNGT